MYSILSRSTYSLCPDIDSILIKLQNKAVTITGGCVSLNARRAVWIAFARLLRELDLDVDPPGPPGRPPGR